MVEDLQLVSVCSMRELVILAALVSALHAASLPTDSDVEYKCREDQDKTATLAAERFINEHHHHGYKFKFVSQDSRSAEKVSFYMTVSSCGCCCFKRVYEEYFNNIMKEKNK